MGDGEVSGTGVEIDGENTASRVVDRVHHHRARTIGEDDRRVPAAGGDIHASRLDLLAHDQNP